MTQADLITKRLDGKIAVITGGNSGIGLATAQRFVQEGAYIFINGRRQNELELGPITESQFDKVFSINVKYSPYETALSIQYSPYKRRFRYFKIVVLSF